MNICLLVSSMGAGGAERVAATLSNGWNTRGYKVTLIATYSNRGDCVYYLDPNIELIFLSDHVQRSGLSGIYKIRRFMALREILKTRSPSVIVSFLTNVNVATIAVSIALSSPVVVAERSHPPQMKIGWKLALLRRLTYPFAARVVMLTSLGLKWLETNVFAAHGIVVSNPIIFPMKSVAPTHKPADYFDNNRKVLLAVGRLAPEKQIHHLIRAFSILAKQNHDWDLAIVGAGPLLASLQNLVLTLELDERVKFIGRAGNIGDWYERADIYVLCSQFEGFPNTLAEAMAYGCAVVSYDCDTGPRDIVTSGVDGILVPPNNEEILANEIARLMADKATRERLAQAAEAVRVRFGLPRILDNWDAVFADLQVALT